MAATRRTNFECQKKYQKIADSSCDPLEKLQAQVLSRGCTGIKALGRSFRIQDDNGDKKLCRSEFKKGLRTNGLDLNQKEADDLFDQFDVDDSESISFDEFMIKMRGKINKRRKGLIIQAFRKLDRTGDGCVTIEDLKGVYDVRNHQKVKSGEWSEDRCLSEFLSSFDTPNNKDGKITEDEFLDYYAGVSASIDNDCYFDLMMRKAWKL